MSQTVETPDAAPRSAPARFRAAVEARDLDAALALFTPDVVFNSPIAHRPYHGQQALRAVLTAVLKVFENFRYVAEYSGPDGHILEFRAEVNGLEIHGMDILRGTAELDQLTELTVLVRPYSAATALKERMAALLAQ